jgi:hypothetical protein
MRRSLIFLFSAFLLASVPTGGAAQTLAIDGDRGAGNLRVGGDSEFAVGQTFTPLGPSLLDFSFWFAASGSATPYVGEWNEAGDSLAAIVWSGVKTSVTANVLTTFGTGGIPLDPSLQYVAYVTSPNETTVARTSNDVYAGGRLTQKRGIPAVGEPWTRAGSSSISGRDAWRFRATFGDPVSVPEPGSVLLLITSLVGLSLAGGRRYRA